jgi:hypothetical protein
MATRASRPRASATCRKASCRAILAVGLLLAGCASAVVGDQSQTAAPSVPPLPTAPPSAAPSLTPVPQASASSDASGCVSLNLDYGPDARGKAGDLVGVATTDIAGLQAGDVVKRDVPTDVGSSVLIVRAGEIIGTVVYFPDQHGGWLLFSGVLCGGLGVKS